MWCIGVLSAEYRQRMDALLELYARPMSRAEPVICIDEKSLQLIGHSRKPLPIGSHSPVKQNYEYVRNGTTNLLNVSMMCWADAGPTNSCAAWSFTPKHASWLNMAEIEIGILSRQCLDRRIANHHALQTEVDAWQQARNAERRTIEWSFTRQDADRKLGRHYVSQLTC